MDRILINSILFGLIAVPEKKEKKEDGQETQAGTSYYIGTYILLLDRYKLREESYIIRIKASLIQQPLR